MEVRVRLALAFALALACGDDEHEDASKSAGAGGVTPAAEGTSPDEDEIIEDDATPADQRLEGMVEPGQTFGQILNDHELKGPEIRLVVRAMSEYFDPHVLKVGQEYALIKKGGALVGVEFATRRGRRVLAEKGEEGWTARVLDPQE